MQAYLYYYIMSTLEITAEVIIIIIMELMALFLLAYVRLSHQYICKLNFYIVIGSVILGICALSIDLYFYAKAVCLCY